MRPLSITLALVVLCAAPPVSSAEPKFELQGNELKLPGPVLFKPGSAELDPASAAVLGHVKGYLVAKPYISLMRIESHTDSTGNAQANQALSEKRAFAAGVWLVSQGIDCKRLIAVGFGGTKPVADNSTPDGRAQNRRTVFANAALRGKAIGGMPVDGGGKVARDLCF